MLSGEHVGCVLYLASFLVGVVVVWWWPSV
jgi:hypothetical protein